jgi:tetratricopeptide (TPR) repeat protein
MAPRSRALALQIGLAAILATAARAQAPAPAQAAPPPGSQSTAESAPLATQPGVPASDPVVPADESAPKAAQASAREAYARGQTLFADGKYAEAKLAFDEAYALVPNPVVLLSSAECDARLGSIESAHALLQRYLSERPDAPDRAQIEQKAAALRATPALLMLSSEPRGAGVAIDGNDSEVRTPAAIYVRPGEHEVVLTRPGYVSASERVVARMGARQTLRLSLQPVAGVPAAAPPQSAGASESTGVDSAPIWISAIVSGAAFVTGGVLGVLALREQQKFDDYPTEETADRGERLALFADVALGVGVIAGITAAVLYFAEDEAPVAVSSPRADRVAISPLALSHGAGLRASGRF